MSGGPAFIVFEGVSKSFRVGRDDVDAIRDVSFAADKGEFITLLGPSGCGKSTLLNLIAGLFRPSTGSVRYAGREVTAVNIRTGYMAQNDHLLPWRDVVGNIGIPLEIAGMPKRAIADRVQGLVEAVGLAGFERAYPSQLSGGMKKRTALARLLAYDPETLLMDEPFAALDTQLRLRMQIDLKALCRRLRKTVLFVTHDLDEAAALADRIVLLTGRPGTLESVVKSPLAPGTDLRRLRRDPAFLRLTAELWDRLVPLDSPVSEA